MNDERLGRVVLGRYRIVSQLGKGGMGAVYLGRTEGAAGFTRPVVIKHVLPDLMGDPETSKMFAREARILSNLQHPGIVNVIDFAEEGGGNIMVMEYVHGYDLSRWCAYLVRSGRQLSSDYGVYTMIRVLEALDHAHNLKRADGTPRRIVHRDVSPTNILIGVEGGVKLLDFGIARMSGDTGEFKTAETSFKGKLVYAPPELLHGAPPSAQSDIYSTAVVLYQALTRENPFRGQSLSETVNNIMNGELRPIAEVRDDVPKELDLVLAKAMKKDPSARYQRAAEFAQRLRTTLTQSEAEVAHRFAEDVRKDFSDDALSKTLGVQSLGEREASWRSLEGASGTLSSSPPALAKESAARHESKERTEFDQQTATGEESGTRLSMDSPLQASKGVTLALMLGAAAVVVAVVGVVVWLGQSRPDEAPRYFVLDKKPASELPKAGSPAPAMTSRPESGRKLSLSQKFTRNMGPIKDCLDRFGRELGSGRQLSILFDIDADGKVTSTGLEPQSLESTKAGACVLQAARRIGFGPQDAPKSFSIPLKTSFD